MKGIYLLTIYIQKILHSDWQRACQLIPKVQKLKFFECRKTKLVPNVEIKNDGQVPQNAVTKQTQNHLQKHAEDAGAHSEKLFKKIDSPLELNNSAKKLSS